MSSERIGIDQYLLFVGKETISVYSEEGDSQRHLLAATGCQKKQANR